MAGSATKKSGTETARNNTNMSLYWLTSRSSYNLRSVARARVMAGASDATEWVAQIRTLSTVFGPYYVQESLHPNWWGEKAIRNCVRQAYNGGAVRGGVCNRSTGLNANGEPNMTLV